MPCLPALERACNRHAAAAWLVPCQPGSRQRATTYGWSGCSSTGCPARRGSWSPPACAPPAHSTDLKAGLPASRACPQNFRGAALVRRRHVRLDFAHDWPRHQRPAGHDLEGPRSAMGIQAVAIERCSDLAEPLCAQLAPVWELVASIPTPGCDHRQHEDPALAQQVLIDTRIVLTDLFGGMGEVEFDRPTATCLEVDEQQPVLRGEHVTWVRLAVQVLLGAAALADHSPQAS